MTALPSKTPLVDDGYSKQLFRDALGGVVDFLSGLFGTAGTPATAQAAMQVFIGAGVATKSTTYTIANTDRGKVLLCSGTWTLTMLAAATAGEGFAIAINNTGSGTITINGDSDVTTVAAGGSVILACTGSAWVSVGGQSGTIPISQGGTGATTAAGARSALGVKPLAPGAGGIGAIYVTLSSTSYTVGSLYSLTVNGLVGTWRCMSKTTESTISYATYRYLYSFEREY